MLAPKRKPSTADKEQFYVDPERFRTMISEYYKTDDCTKELGESINKIAEGLSHSPNFQGYTYRDEMIGDAIVKMYSALKFKKFNIKSETSPFAYFTTIAFHAFINRIKKEKKHHETVESYKEDRYEQMLTLGGSPEEHFNIYTKPVIEDEENFDDSE